MQPLPPPPSALKVPVFRSDAPPPTRIPFDALQRPAQDTPTLAELGQGKPFITDSKTGKVYRRYDPVTRKKDLLELYAAQIQADEKLEAAINENMNALVGIYDNYYPIFSKGLGNGALEALLCARMGQEEKSIQDAIEKLSCPLKKFKAEYRLAILVEDEEVYQKLIKDFFNKLFGTQNKDQRLELLQFLTKPSPRPLTPDFEFLRLSLFYNLIHNKELPFEWVEKKALLEAVLSFAARCLAYRSVSKDVFQFWDYCLTFKQAYTRLIEDPECLELKEVEGLTFTEVLMNAFECAQADLSQKLPLKHLAFYHLILAILKADRPIIQELGEDLSSCKVADLPLEPLQVHFLIKLYLSLPSAAFDRAVLQVLMKLYFLLIDQPANYIKRWEQMQTLGLTLIEAAQERAMPLLLNYVKGMLKDNQADLEYKKTIKTHLQQEGCNRMNVVEFFNQKENQTRLNLNKKLEAARRFLAKK